MVLQDAHYPEQQDTETLKAKMKKNNKKNPNNK